MIDCLILGDSIAVGTHMFKPECVSYSKGGYNTWQWNKKYLNNDLTSDIVIISLGTNDHKYVKTYDELVKLRNKVKARRVYWVMPAIKPDVQNIIRSIAFQYNDIVLPINDLQSDKIHPSLKGYKDIIDNINNIERKNYESQGN